MRWPAADRKKASRKASQTVRTLIAQGQLRRKGHLKRAPLNETKPLSPDVTSERSAHGVLVVPGEPFQHYGTQIECALAFHNIARDGSQVSQPPLSLCIYKAWVPMASETEAKEERPSSTLLSPSGS